VHRDKFLITNQVDALISQIYFGRKLYMFRTVPLSTIRRFSLYTQQWYMSYRFADSASSSVHHQEFFTVHTANLYDIYHCCVYSEKLLMVDRGTVQNM